MIGRLIEACPRCGSRACAARARTAYCPHTRLPRLQAVVEATGTSTDPAAPTGAQRKARNR